MFVRLIYISLLLFLWAESISAQNTDPFVLKVVTEDVYPMTYIDKDNGEVKGYAYHYLMDILEKESIEHTLDVLPWSRAYKTALTQPNILIYGLARTKQREAKFIWLKDFLTLDFNLYGLKSRQQEITRSDNNYKNSPIGVLRHDYNHIEMKANGYTNLVTSDNISQLGALLRKGRIDFIVEGGVSFNFLDERNGLVKGSIYQVQKLPFLNVPIYYALSKNSDPELEQKLRAAIKALSEDPSYQQPSLNDTDGQ